MKRVLLVCMLMIACKPQEDKLPILSFTINEAGEKEIYNITYSGEFVNQFGEEFTNDKLDDKVIIANFFFTRCPSICPPMRQQLIGISETIDDDDFLMISHSIDPTNDTPEVLEEYAEATGIPNERWQFLTATEAITKAMAEQYKTNFKPFEDGTDFYHSSYAALIDKDKKIRGFYDLLKPMEVELMIKDIDHLLN